MTNSRVTAIGIQYACRSLVHCLLNQCWRRWRQLPCKHWYYIYSMTWCYTIKMIQIWYPNLFPMEILLQNKFEILNTIQICLDFIHLNCITIFIRILEILKKKSPVSAVSGEKSYQLTR